MDVQNNYLHRCKIGEKLSIRPLILINSKLILCAVKNLITAFDIDSTNHIFELTLSDGRISAIDSICENQNFIVVSTFSGVIILLDLIQKKIVRREKINDVIKHTISINNGRFIIFHSNQIGTAKINSFEISVLKFEESDISLSKIRKIDFPSVQNCAYNSISKILLVGNKKDIYVYSTDSVSLKSVFTSQYKIQCLALHPFQEVYAVGFVNGLITVNRIEDNTQIARLYGQKGEISDMAFMDDGSRIFYSDDNNALICWNLKTFKSEFVLKQRTKFLLITLIESILYLSDKNNIISIVHTSNFSSVKSIVKYRRDEKDLGMIWCSKSQTLMMSNQSNYIDFYSPNFLDFDYSLKITSPDDYEQAIYYKNNEFTVERMILSKDSRFLFILELSNTGRHSRLNVWSLNGASPYDYKFVQRIQSEKDDKICLINTYIDPKDSEVLITVSIYWSISFWVSRISTSGSKKCRWRVIKSINMKSRRISFIHASSYNNALLVVYARGVDLYDLKSLQRTTRVKGEKIQNIIPASHSNENLALFVGEGSIKLFSYTESDYLWQYSVILKCVNIDPVTSNIFAFYSSSKHRFSFKIFKLMDFSLLQCIQLGCSMDIISCAIGDPLLGKCSSLLVGSCIYFMTSQRDIYLIREDAKTESNVGAVKYLVSSNNNYYF